MNRFLFNLTTLVGAMFDTEGVTNLAEEATGTGPYTFVSWDHGSMIELARNDDYHGDAPYFATVEMHYFRDANALNNAMLTDAIDVIGTVQAPESLAEFEGGDYQIIEGTTNGEIVLSMNQQEDMPLADLRLRQAVRYAIDHQALMDTCWDGHGTLIGSMVPPTDPWYEDRTGDYPFDPERAQELIAEADAEGTELRLRLPTLPYAQACGIVVESMLEEAGFVVTVDSLEFPATWLEDVFTNKDYDMSIVSHVEGRDLGDVFGNPDYYTTYGTAEIRQILDDADSGTEDEQVAKMQEAATLISQDAAADFLFLLPNLMIADPDITGLPINSLRESLDLSALSRG
ncbi:ABC transporter substrate-binding protein [uncultured Ornithinimicrobium sp.]|uniref:ABC transporter substrate-binding protein n=1 Tax=uncultured Ornithinimicrobium sp. TaxID=259307 RepID=UPI00259AD765|nr:ABC transporter substrate-binding protein [uncultured Ornithinimicrobium sp.]